MAIGLSLLLLSLLLGGAAIGSNEAGKASYANNRDDLRRLLSNPDGSLEDSNIDPSKISSLGLSNSDVDSILDEYWNDPFDLFNPNTWGRKHGFDYDRFNSDLDEFLKMRDELGDMPSAPDYDAIAAAADRDIDAENNRVLALYDQMLGRSNDLFESEMANNNAMYNDYVNQVQANNAMATQSIAGSTRYEMDRARRNAITRGASAAQRLTANVNAQLGLQNRAAQQQLETSNQLASALLQQRQAAAQLRGDYVNNMNADASRRAGLISGTAERKTSLKRGYESEAESRYDADREQWLDRLNGRLGDNPFANIYRNKQYGSRGTNTYGY